MVTRHTVLGCTQSVIGRGMVRGIPTQANLMIRIWEGRSRPDRTPTPEPTLKPKPKLELELEPWPETKPKPESDLTGLLAGASEDSRWIV